MRPHLDRNCNHPKADRFLKSRRSKETTEAYHVALHYVLDPKVNGNLDQFLELPKDERENILVDYISSKKDVLASSTLHMRIVACHSFLQDYEVLINWKRIRGILPINNHVADDRAPTKEEIRKALATGSLLVRAVILTMASCGCRVGALTGLQLKDYTKVPIKDKSIGCLKLYKGSAEHYKAYMTPEAVEALDLYLAFRKRKGEVLSPESYLFVNRVGEPLTKNAVQSAMWANWLRCGVRPSTLKDKGKGRHEFKENHGFRKFFRTFAPIGMKPDTARDDVEILLGHKLNYYKPTEQYVFEQFIRAIPSLAIGEAENLKVEMKEKEEEFNRKFEALASKTSQDISALRLEVLQAQVRQNQALKEAS
ncbi:MAG: tyrosine-type recombinase/integrase [Nitrososphaerales archaeon]